MTGVSYLRRQLERLLRVEPAAKPAIYRQLFDASDRTSLEYWIELVMSAGIATLGLVLDSPAVVIGAMLISPLMGPILALGLALTLGDLYLGVRSAVTIAFSIVLAVVVSAAIAWMLPFHATTNEILARSQPTLLDLGVALLSGLAGSIVMSKGGGGGGVMALPGVAIAVALMPPLCTAGLAVGSAFPAAIRNGASLLFVTNLAAIATMAFATFFVIRMDDETLLPEFDAIATNLARRDGLRALLLRTTHANPIGEGGTLRWRVLMLAVTLALLFVPLRRSLMEVRDETIARTAVNDALAGLAPAGTIVTQQISPTGDPILVRLIVTANVPEEKVRQAEQFVAARTGRQVDLVVRKVASEEELALLRQDLRRLPPAPAPPAPPPTLDAIRSDLLGRLEPPLKQLWPSESAELLGAEIGFDGEGVILRLRYAARRPLDTTAEQVLANAIKAKLGVQTLRVSMTHERAARPEASKAQRPPANRGVTRQ
ncbi:MAG TPA: DUF389 domain-containing protein [Vicinamibacterales bacterium]|nr:DUF389 domain-containing protein [Vicinamibacterales bacterium]